MCKVYNQTNKIRTLRPKPTIMIKSLYFICFIAFISCNSSVKKEHPNYDSIETDAKNKIANAEEIDSLSKYSYMIVLYKNRKNIGHGTGFFVRQNDKLYLISAYHLLSGINTEFCRTLEIRPDSLSFDHTENGFPKRNYLNLREVVKHSKPFYTYDSADIYAYDITALILNSTGINSIERFITEIPKGKIPDDILSYGYPGEIYNSMGQNPNVTHLSPSGTVYDTLKSRDIGSDIIHVWKSYYFLKGHSEGGMSGSPIFNIYINAGKRDVKFAGLISSHTKTKDTAKVIVVRPQVLASKLKFPIYKNLQQKSPRPRAQSLIN